MIIHHRFIFLKQIRVFLLSNDDSIDVHDISAVVNFDFPKTIEDYIHRIGRTGRAGAKGVSFSFFSENNARLARGLIRVLEEASMDVDDELRTIAAEALKRSVSRREVSLKICNSRNYSICGIITAFNHLPLVATLYVLLFLSLLLIAFLLF